MKWVSFFLLLALCAFITPAAHAAQRNLTVTKSAGEQKRVALVIGNAAYKGASPLRNPVNDAKAMSDALNGLGFQVIEVTDATQKEMNRAITEFGKKLNQDTAALFFYAGHGIQVKGKNYLVPIDAQIDAESAVSTETVNMDGVMEQLNLSSISVVILDACRNNPFERSFRKMGGGGLAQMDAPKGSFIAYATAPGKTASDGDGKNGLFTQEILKQIGAPGLSLEEVFKRVRANVLKVTGDAQMPWDSSSLTGSFYFKPGAVVQVASLKPEAVRVQSAEEIEQEFWNRIKDSKDAEDFDAYLSQYPQGRYAALAGAEIKRIKRQSAPPAKPAPAANTTAAQGCPDCPVMVAIPGRNYEMGKHEVTQKEWRDVMGSDPPELKFKGCDNCPVERVSWNDAQEYIQKLNQKTGRQYRLPNEAEWEYACYGGSQTEYCGGNNIDAVAWYDGNSNKQPHTVGQKQANGYGLYDMSGNVWEWMENCYDGKCTERALRGGSWIGTPQNVALRNHFVPAFLVNGFGFRLARTL